jgi:hypothetical protein
MKSFESIVKDKKVLVIGPAKCVKDDIKLINMDDYDLIVRLNLHWRLTEADKKILGDRTDIIYHCFNKEQYTVEELEQWKNSDIVIVARGWVTDSTQKAIIFQERNKDVGLEYYTIPKSFFNSTKKSFDNINPNTGVLAILHLCSLGVDTTVIGFDFYESLYWNKMDVELYKTIHNTNHKPRLQLNHFRRVIKKYKNFHPVGKLRKLIP